MSWGELEYLIDQAGMHSLPGCLRSVLGPKHGLGQRVSESSKGDEEAGEDVGADVMSWASV